MEFSIIIPTRNRSDLLLQCIDSIQHMQYQGFEVIVVDDGSLEKERVKNKCLVQSMRKKGLVISYFFQQQKYQGAARNLGIEKAKGKYVIFLDDDCEVEKGWLAAFHRCFQDKKVQACFGLILPYDDKNMYSVVSHLSERHYENKNGEEVFPSLVYNLAVRREVLSSIQARFDERIANKAEDIAFNYLLYQHQISVVFCSAARCLHKYPVCFKDFFSDQVHFCTSRRWRRHHLYDYPYVSWNRNSPFRKIGYAFRFPWHCFQHGVREGVNPFGLLFLALFQEFLYV